MGYQPLPLPNRRRTRVRGDLPFGIPHKWKSPYCISNPWEVTLPTISTVERVRRLSGLARLQLPYPAPDGNQQRQQCNHQGNDGDHEIA